jgi:hypothetical protein
MRRKEDRPLQKVTLNLFDGDYAALQSLYPRPGAGKIIRELVRRHLRDSEAINRPVTELPIDLDELDPSDNLVMQVNDM